MTRKQKLMSFCGGNFYRNNSIGLYLYKYAQKFITFCGKNGNIILYLNII